MLNSQLRKSFVVAGSTLLLAALPSAAQAHTWKASATDPTGDGPVPGRDITEVKFRYTSGGSVLFVVTLAGPIDATNADAAVGASVGATCETPLLTGGGLFSSPDPVTFAAVRGKKLGKPRKGAGEITGNVYTLEVKARAFKGWKPKCFAVALVDPNAPKDQVPTPFDQTGEIKIKG